MRWWDRVITRREFSLGQRAKDFEDAGRNMDKHTFMHCIVNMVSDREDLTDQDKRMLCLRLGIWLSETPRPERK